MAQGKLNKVFVRLGHDCDMAEEEDEVVHQYPGNSIGTRMKRGLIRNFLISEKMCKSCTIYLRSHGSIIKERKRHLKHHPHIIHPFSVFRICWDFVMLIVCFCQLMMVPCDMAYSQLKNTFPSFSSVYYKVARTLLDLFCCLDVIINAFTGYYDEAKKEIVLNHGRILLNYLRKTLIIDVLSSIPTHWDLVCTVDPYLSEVLRNFSSITLWRYYTYVIYYNKLTTLFNVNFYVRQSVSLSTSLLVYWNFLACLQLFGWINTESRNKIIRLDKIQNLIPLQVFAENMYHGALFIYTASFGPSLPMYNSDYIIITLVWFLSKFIQVFFLARVIEFLKANTSPKQKYSQMVKQLTEFMRHKQLPIYTQRRILKYYEFHFQKSYFREHEIYATISGQLRQEIVMQTCKQLVENVEFFRNLPLNLLIRIVSCLKSEVYLTNDVIVRANSLGKAMFFISSGTVAVYTTTGKEVCHLEDGAHFGEIALVMENKLRVASVIAVEVCELFRLDRKDFVKAIHPYPDLLDKIQRVAADRMEKTIMLDEHHKREMAIRRH